MVTFNFFKGGGIYTVSPAGLNESELAYVRQTLHIEAQRRPVTKIHDGSMPQLTDLELGTGLLLSQSTAAIDYRKRTNCTIYQAYFIVRETVKKINEELRREINKG